MIYLVAILLVNKNKKSYRLKRFLAFTLLYGLITFLIVPYIAPFFGRQKIKDSSIVKAQTFITKLTNWNYVTTDMNKVLQDVSLSLQKRYPKIKLVYLDANFPFFDGFPLLPHLSHDDGKKIDITFIYENTEGTITNLKKSNSGYGIFISPINKEHNQTRICKSSGFWQYDYNKYLTFGKVNSHLTFSDQANTILLELISEHPKTQKIFIEPHLKERLQLTSKKIRFHGCKSVRHDDHIHFQVL